MAGSRVHPWLRKSFAAAAAKTKARHLSESSLLLQTLQCFGCVGRQRFRCIFNSLSIAESQVPLRYIGFQIMTTRKVPSSKDWISQTAGRPLPSCLPIPASRMLEHPSLRVKRWLPRPRHDATVRTLFVHPARLFRIAEVGEQNLVTNDAAQFWIFDRE